MEFYPDLCVGKISASRFTGFKIAYVLIQNKGTYWSKASTMKLTVGGFTTFANVPALAAGGHYLASVSVPMSLHGRTVSAYVDVNHVNVEDPNWANNAASQLIP